MFPCTLRIARPVTNLNLSDEMYRKGLSCKIAHGDEFKSICVLQVRRYYQYYR